ncbi:MAG: hypothetical protein AB9836_04325 [Aminipila sp.]
MFNKKGSLMVEAAIIYPLAIGAIMAVIYIIICMYTGNAIKASINIELRAKVFEMTQTGEKIINMNKFIPEDKYGKGAFNKKIYITEEKNVEINRLYGVVSHGYKGNSLMSETFLRKHQGTVYLIDEKEYIRKVDMVL